VATVIAPRKCNLYREAGLLLVDARESNLRDPPLHAERQRAGRFESSAAICCYLLRYVASVANMHSFGASSLWVAILNPHPCRYVVDYTDGEAAHTSGYVSLYITLQTRLSPSHTDGIQRIAVT